MTERSSSSSVLLLSPDPSVLAVLFSVLRREVGRALFARSRKEAVEIASRYYIPIDLVICDLWFSGEDGPTVLDDLRQLRPGVRALYTSSVLDEDALRVQVLHETSPGNFVPVASAGLAAAVRHALTQPPMSCGAGSA